MAGCGACRNGSVGRCWCKSRRPICCQVSTRWRRLRRNTSRHRVCACCGRQDLRLAVVWCTRRPLGTCCSADVCWFLWQWGFWLVCNIGALFTGRGSSEVLNVYVSGWGQIPCHHWLLGRASAPCVESVWLRGALGLRRSVNRCKKTFLRKALRHQTFGLPQRRTVHTIGALREASADVDLRIVNQPLPQLTPFP